MKTRIQFALKIIVTLCGFSLIFFLLRNKLDEVLDIIKNCNVGLFLIALVLYVAANVFSACRLRSVLRMQQIYLPLSKTLKFNFIGYFFNLFLPSSVGGDIAKGYYVYRQSNEKAKSFMSVLIDRMIGLLSLVFLGSISAFMLYGKINNPKILVVVFIMISVSVCIVIFFTHKGVASTLRIIRIPALSKRLIAKISNLYLLVYECKRHKRNVLVAFIFSMIFQFCTFVTNFILAKSLNIPIGLGTFCMLLPLVSLFGLIPSINGLGVREGAYIYFFHFFISTENAFALSLMADIFLFSCSFIGLICFLFHKEFTIKEIKTSKIELNNMEMNNNESLV